MPFPSSFTLKVTNKDDDGKKGKTLYGPGVVTYVRFLFHLFLLCRYLKTAMDVVGNPCKSIKTAYKWNIEFSDLPDSVMLKIFSNLSQLELCKIALVSKHWLLIAYDSELWQHLDLSRLEDISQDTIIRIIQTRLSPLLKGLTLSNCVVKPVVFNELVVKCPLLEYLNLRDCIWDPSTDDCYVTKLLFPKRLARLDMRNFGHGYSSLYLILHAEDLSTLQVFGFGNIRSNFACPKFHDFVRMFDKMSNLRILECFDCDLITDGMVRTIAETLSHLESLSFKKCRNVQGSTLNFAIKMLYKLKSMSLSGSAVQSGNVVAVAWETSKIEEFDLSSCSDVSPECLQSVLPRLVHLKYVSLNNCGSGKAINDNVLAEIYAADLWPNLTTLSMQFCSRVTADGILLLLRCRKLQRLSLRACHRFGFTEITKILPFFPNLRALEVGTLFSDPQKCTKWFELLKSLGTHCASIETLILVKCSGTTLGTLSQYRPLIQEFLHQCSELKEICLLYCDAGIVNSFEICIKNQLQGRKARLTTAGGISIIPPPKYSLDAHMKKSKGFSKSISKYIAIEPSSESTDFAQIVC